MTGSSGKSQRALVLLVVLMLSSIVVGISIRIPNGGVLPEAFAHLGGDECTLLGGNVVGAECQISSFVAKTSTAHGGSFDISETLRIKGDGRIDASGGGITINISGDLILESPTVATGGQIEANDPSSPSGSSASSIALNVSGNVEMQAGTVIEARNIVGYGNGANIAITVTGNLLMAGATGSTPGARIESSGGLNTSAGNLVFVVGGDMEMQAGSVVRAESGGNGNGGSITVTVTGSLTLRGTITGPPLVPGAIISSSVLGGTAGNAGGITVNVGNCTAKPPTGDLLVEPGAKVQANTAKGAGGAIVMNSCRHIKMDGLVESASGRSGTGAKQGPGGGTITLDAGCDLTISDEGKVSSRGQDPGADLVHLEGGCSVLIFGLVESIGRGHAVPNSPPNHCNNAYRPDKHPSSTTCVEVWAGDILTIDSDAGEGHNGEVSADGGPGGRGWIDLFARGDITIDGDASGPFAVHANRAGGTNQVGGTVTVKSTEGNVTASDLAISADGYVSGGTGGWIIIEAALDVDLDTASLYARGDLWAMGGYGKGGQVSIRSFNGTVSWQNGVGDVQPTGTGIVSPGVITLQDCASGSIDKTGTSFPVTAGSATTPTELGDSCGGAPTLPSYVVLPPCLCREFVPPPCKWCTKGAVLSQVTQNIGYCCAVPDILVDLRLPKDDPILPEELGSNSPATGSLQAAIDYVNRPDWPSLDPTPLNETFIGVTAQDCDTGIAGSCGNQTGRGPNGDGTENVVITNVHQTRLNVFGCSIDLFAANASKPVVTIANSTGKVTVLDIHVHGSTVAGYLIQNNDDLVVVKNSRSFGASGIGYWIKDDDVEITGSPEISGHNIGILIEGNNVKLRTNNDIVNNGIGIKITGDNNESNDDDVGKSGKPNGIGILVKGKGNLLQGDSVIYNTGDGIVIAGSGTSLADGNFVTDEEAQHNGGNGIVVSGNYNTLDRNRQVKFNTGEGIKVTGANNYLNENNAEENGQNGIRASSEDGASNNNLEGNEAKNNPLQGIRACNQNDLGDNDGEGNGVNPQVDFLCAYPDLTITKTDDPDPVAGGADLTYTLTVSNSATATASASDVKVVDTLPSDATFVSASGDHGFTCSYASGKVTCTGGSIAVGESATITIKVKFGASCCGDTVKNTAEVDPDGDIIELNEDNNTTGEVQTKVNCVDLTISKSAPETVESGAELTYTLTVGNSGTADASGVKVADTLPTGATYVSASGTNGFTCSEAGGVVTCTGGSIAVSGSATITIKVTFGASLCGKTVKNTAVVDPDNTIVESDESRNTASAETKVICADLDVTIYDDTPSGEDLNSFGGYTSKIQYKLTNGDDADIDSVTFTGTFTGTATRSGATRTFSGDSTGWDCTTINTNGWSCSGPLGAGDEVFITLSVTGPSGQDGKTVVYEVTPAPVCTGPGPCTDGVASPANSDGLDVTPGPDTDNLVEPLFIDLTISKTDSPDPVKAGNNLTYTLTVGNAGNQNAAAVKVVDTLDSDATFVSASGTNGFSCTYASATGKVTCTGGSINAGSSATITIKVTFDASFCGQSVTNKATVDPDNDIPESNNSNNTTGDVDTDVICADLDVTLTDNPGSEDLNPSGGYTSKIKYRLLNDDDADIGSVTFTGTFSGSATRSGASLAAITGTGPAGNWTCTITTSGWSCTGPLPAGKYVDITFSVTGTGTSGQTIIYTVTPAPVCTDPGPCIDDTGTDSPANSDHSDVTPGPDTDTLS